MDKNVINPTEPIYYKSPRIPGPSYNYGQIQIDQADPKNIVYIFVYGIPSAYNGSFESVTSTLPKGLSDMLDDFKRTYVGFCQGERSIHSFWSKVDQSNKEIVFYTFIDALDFDLEKRIFDGPYGELPPIFDDYYIDLRVDPIEVPDYIHDEFKLEYMRES